MSDSIVTQLVLKDLRIMRLPVVLYWLGGFLSIAIVIVGGERVGMAGTILFISAMAGAGFHAVWQTVVEERREHTLPFIMSLPISVREYTSAKLLANLLMFLSVWVTLSVASFIVFVGDNGLPDGSLPFLTIVLVGILLAYTIILAVALVGESIGWAITAMVGANLGTQIYLWAVSDLYGVRSVVSGNVVVWNATFLTILGAQLALIIGLIGATYVLQARKTDFV